MIYLDSSARAVQDLACDVEAPALRTRDALHLAAALLLADVLTGFVAYHGRLLRAARDVGPDVASPGRFRVLTTDPPIPGPLPRHHGTR